MTQRLPQPNPPRRSIVSRRRQHWEDTTKREAGRSRGPLSLRLGTSVDLPSNIFSIDSGPVQKGSGRQFQSRDGRAKLLVYTLSNRDRDSPASHLKKHLAVNARILHYRRVTSRFFVVSGVRRGSVFYSRCNFETKTQGNIGCFFIEYPESDTKAWDRIVTRMSLSLR